MYMWKNRSRRGATIAEFAAAMVVTIPLLLLILVVAVEMGHAYLINTVLSQAAEKAAREMALKWETDSTVNGSKAIQDVYVYDYIRNDGIIASSDQFDVATFDTTSDPKTVSVTVRYDGGQFGLTPFPAFDPLNLGANFPLVATAKYRLN
jgi:Flp pilus assembly protein TadG